jgi:hypothetical protein
MTNGPFLYDDEPEPLHTGTPRSRNGQMVAVLVATALLAVLTVAALFVFRGSAAEQSEEAVGVFLAALEAGDTETAHQLLCTDERAGIEADELVGGYTGSLPGEVVGSTDAGEVQQVEVRWADGGTSEYSVISEGGARLCGREG